jgi:hypothetical protein
MGKLTDFPQRKKRLLFGAAAVIGGGIILGIIWAARDTSAPVVPEPGDTGTVQTVEEQPAFGRYFTLFTLGRSGEGRRIGKNTLLVPVQKFQEGERAGVRVSTASKVTEPLRVEVRILASGTREETPALRKLREQFTVRPGLFSYCCVTMPKGPGPYVVGILIGNEFVGFRPIIVRPARQRSEGGIFAPL